MGRARAELREFIDELKAVQEKVGSPSLRDLQRLTADHERQLTRSTVSNKLNLQSVPEWIFVDAFLCACERFAATSEGIALNPSEQGNRIDLDTGETVIDRKPWSRRHDEILAAVERLEEDNRFAARANAERDRKLAPKQLPSRARHFTGRGAELTKLDQLLENNRGDQVGIYTVRGTAGVGKTTLAIEWAHRVMQRFPDGQLYVNLQGFDPQGTPLSPAQVLRGFLGAFGVPVDRMPPTVDAQASLYRSLVAERKVLLILDNAASIGQVRPLLPGSPTCRVVVTSRAPLAGLTAVEGAVPLQMDPLAAGEARTLMARQLRDSRPEPEPDAVAEIVDLCARLPLAISIISARAAQQPDLPLATLLSDLKNTQQRLAALDTTDDARSNVRAAFSWSYRFLTDYSARLFRLLAAHPGPEISAPAVASLLGVGETRARALLDELSGVRLIDEQTAGRFSFHDLLRLFAAELSSEHDTESDRAEASRRSLDHYLHSTHAAVMAWDPHRDRLLLPDGAPGVSPVRFEQARPALSWLTMEYPVLLATIRQAATSKAESHAWRVAWCLVDFMHRQGHWGSGDAVVRSALKAAETTGDKPGQARMHRGLGRREIVRGALDEARHCLHTALALFVELDDAAGIAHTHIDLAHLDANHDNRSALDHAEQALHYYRAANSPAGLGNALNSVGWFHAQLGAPQRGLDSCRSALDLLRQVGDVAGQAAALDSLGYISQHLGQNADADNYYRQALELFKQGDDPYMQADTLDHIGDNLLALNQPAQARRAWERAVTIFEQMHYFNRADDLRSRVDGMTGQDG